MILPFAITMVTGCDRAEVVARVEVDAFTPRYLYVPEATAHDFAIASIMVGRRELLAGLGEVPAMAFSLLSFKTLEELKISDHWAKILANFVVDSPRLVKGDTILLRIRNLHPALRNFSGCFFGAGSVEDDIVRSIAEEKTAKLDLPSTISRCYACNREGVKSGQLCPRCRD